MCAGRIATVRMHVRGEVSLTGPVTMPSRRPGETLGMVCQPRIGSVGVDGAGKSWSRRVEDSGVAGRYAIRVGVEGIDGSFEGTCMGLPWSEGESERDRQKKRERAGEREARMV